MNFFGKDLFNFKKEPKPMYDFYKWLNNSAQFIPVAELVQEQQPVTSKKGKKKVVKEEIKITPKGLYQMKALNAREFAINADPEYIAKQVDDAKYKLEIMAKPPKQKKRDPFMPEFGGAVKYGRDEVESIIERLNNRLKIADAKDILEEFPHTTNSLVNDVLMQHKHLQMRTSDSFVPDFPRDAIAAMKKYNDMCVKIGGKKSVFYVIADGKDFDRVSKRRDPILLAQSPFGFFWQILGAWDREIIYLGDL